jgi:hypothetical protein
LNTIGTSTTGASYREKYFSSTFQKTLDRALVTSAITLVDKSGDKYIQNPYSSEVTALVQALAGTYSVSAWTITDEALTVADEFTYGEHIYGHEKALVDFDLMNDRMDKIALGLKNALDIWALNELCEGGTGTYSTPSGGFTMPANIPVIVANVISKVAGYDMFTGNGLYMVLEAGDTVGLIQYQFGTGFSYADLALNNGLIGHVGGVDIYVVLDGTFADATTTAASGSKTWTNSGHRVAGIKKVSTFSSTDPRWEEKGVTGKTGMEVVGYCFAGFKQWTNTAAMTIDITVTA